MARTTILTLCAALTPVLALADDTGTIALGRYASGDGLTRIVLDRRAAPVRIRFLGEEEILALYPEPASRGETSLVRDDGYHQMRLTPHGDVSLAMDGRRDPVALYWDGDVEPLEPDPCTPAAWAAAQTMAAKRLGELGVEGGMTMSRDPDPGENAWIWCTALANALTALDRVAATSFGGRAVRRGLARLTIEAGPNAGAKVDGDAIRITVAPASGWLGVASSYRVEDALEQGL